MKFEDEYRTYLRIMDTEARQKLVTRMDWVLEMGASSDIKSVRIDEKDDPGNEDHTCRLVFRHYDGTESRINIECNSISAIFLEFCRFVADGRRPAGAYMYHGMTKEEWNEGRD